MKKFPSRKKNRLKEYDYSENGYYYVTICSKGREKIFGEYDEHTVGEGLAPSRYRNHTISNRGQPQGLSLQTPVRYKNNIKLSKIGKIIDEQWIDIPNQYNNVDIDTFIIMPNHIHGILIVNYREGASPSPTISNVIGSFKSKCSVEYLNYIKQTNLNTSRQIWQRSFYDHIIRNDKSLQEIREYIINNPTTWAEDENNIEKL